MRTRGWSGDVPSDDDDARRRILTATRERLAEGSASTAEIARALGITRQTVYRYFPTTEGLLSAAALDRVGELVEQIAEHVASVGGDAGDAVVEVVAYVFENLRDDPSLNYLLAPGQMSQTLRGVTSAESIDLGRSLLAVFPVDWAAVGLDELRQLELVEHLLRVLQSLLLDPGTRSPDELRDYLQRWVAPALRG